MAEKPILFSTPMVQAILAGRKTQTRRVIKDKDITNWFDIDVDGTVIAYIDQATGDSYPPTAIARYQPGDILWVRETFYHAYATTTVNGLEYVLENTYYYKADYPSDKLNPPWKPSIHMPREAARIFLKVTNVRVERVQEIATDDAKAEGVLQPGVIPSNTLIRNTEGSIPRTNFKILWDSLNASRGFSWEQNPWVWVISFERIEL